MVRTQLTAAPLAAARGLVPVVLDELREVGAGDLEMRSDHDAVTAYLGTVVAWVEGDLDRADARRRRRPRVLRSLRPRRGAGRRVRPRHRGDRQPRRGHPWLGRGARVHGRSAAFVRDHSLDNTGVVALEGDPEAGFRLVSWQGEPVGGPGLDDPAALDPTGEPAEVDA